MEMHPPGVVFNMESHIVISEVAFFWRPVDIVHAYCVAFLFAFLPLVTSVGYPCDHKLLSEYLNIKIWDFKSTSFVLWQ